MKKILHASSKLLLMIAIISSTFFTGCKKGEDDPFMSLRSRNTRITGEWSLKSWEESYTVTRISKDRPSSKEDYRNVNTYTHSLNGTNLIEKEVSQVTSGSTTTTATTTKKYTYTEALKIQKDGTFELTRTKTLTSTTSEITGFSSTTTDIVNPETERNILIGHWNWVDGKKNKSMININHRIYYIKQLKNSEMVLSIETGENDIDYDQFDESNVNRILSSEKVYTKD